MITGATLFTGGGGVDVGMRAAGITPLWGIEYDAQIADVARANGVPVTCADVRAVNPQAYAPVDVLHASPPCPNFSVAKRARGETDMDIALAQATARFIRVLQPRVFTLENVWGYRHAQGFALLLETLHATGYWTNVAHLNAADYGVRQTRKRLWLRAVRGGMVGALPEPEAWRGWYAALADLLPDLPTANFVPWQLRRLVELGGTCLVGAGGYAGDAVRVAAEAPAFTITANSNQTSQVRAFLVTDQSGSAGQGLQIVTDDSPAKTVRANCGGGALPRAFLVDGNNARTDGRLSVRTDSEPSLTVTGGRTSALFRAWLTAGRVVQLTPRCLARLQAFPDTYTLPGNRTLAVKIIGNAVPPLWYTKIVRSLL